MSNNVIIELYYQRDLERKYHIMAIINDDYKISRLPNTFYRISKKSHFFKEDTFEHCMYINGMKKSLGVSYTYNNSLTFKDFVSLLNSYATMNAKKMEQMADNPKIKSILTKLNCLKYKQIIGDVQTCSPSLIFINDETWHLNGHAEVELYKENGKYIQKLSVSKERVTILLEGVFDIVDLFSDEYHFLINYIRVFYLINLPWMTQDVGFPIGNDTSCIIKAQNKGWI